MQGQNVGAGHRNRVYEKYTGTGYRDKIFLEDTVI
jgi:hypothetical protein